MLEKPALLKIVLSGAFAALLATLPLNIQAQEVTDPPTKSGTTTGKAKKATTKTGETKSEAKSERKVSKGQLAARERQKACGAEWREAKAKGTLEKGATWPKYWSACNKRMKDKAKTT